MIEIGRNSIPYSLRTPYLISQASVLGSCNGLDDIKAFMESEAAHPRTHMMTNVYAESDEHGVELRFRIVALVARA